MDSCLGPKTKDMPEARTPETQPLSELDHFAEKEGNTTTNRQPETIPPYYNSSVFMDVDRLRLGFFFSLALVISVTFALSGMVQMFYSLVAYKMSDYTEGVRVAAGVIVIPPTYVLLMGLSHELSIMVFDAMDVPPLLRLRVMLIAIGLPHIVADYLLVAALHVAPVLGGLVGCLTTGRTSPFIRLRGFFLDYVNVAVAAALLCGIIFWFLHRYLSCFGSKDQMQAMRDAIASYKERARPTADLRAAGDAESQLADAYIHEYDRLWMGNKDASPKTAGYYVVAALALLIVLGVLAGSFIDECPFLLLLSGISVALVLLVCGVTSLWPQGVGCTGFSMTTFFILVTLGIQAFTMAMAMDGKHAEQEKVPFFDLPPPPNYTFRQQPVSFYPVCGMRWGSSEVESQLTLSASDVAVFAEAIYIEEAEEADRVVDPNFAGTALGAPMREDFEDFTTVGRWGVWHFPEAKLRIFAVRGTDRPLDVIADGDIWCTVAIMQMFNLLMPVLKILPADTTRFLAGLWSNPFGLFKGIEVWDPIIEKAKYWKKKSDEDTSWWLIAASGRADNGGGRGASNWGKTPAGARHWKQGPAL